jgi:hypothetical protein
LLICGGFLFIFVAFVGAKLMPFGVHFGQTNQRNSSRLGQSMDTLFDSKTKNKMAGVPPSISYFWGCVSAGRVPAS